MLHQHMATTNIIYDLILLAIVAALFASVYGAAWLVHKAAVKHTSGNPFRWPRLKDWQVRRIIGSDR